jgi:hypothetical protein
VGWLHRLPYHPHQVVAKCIQVCFVAQFHREPFKRLGCVVLVAVEAAIYEGLYASSQGVEQSSDNKGGDDYSQLGLLLLAGERTEHRLGRSYPAEVDQNQHRRKSAVDEGAVYEEVYVIEAVAEDRDTSRDGEANGRYNPGEDGNPYAEGAGTRFSRLIASIPSVAA